MVERLMPELRLPVVSQGAGRCFGVRALLSVLVEISLSNDLGACAFADVDDFLK